MLKSVIATKPKTSNVESTETDSSVIEESKKISQSFAKYFSKATTKLRQHITSVSSNNFKFSQVSETFVAK